MHAHMHGHTHTHTLSLFLSLSLSLSLSLTHTHTHTHTPNVCCPLSARKVSSKRGYCVRAHTHTHTQVGGVRTNFPMPDVHSIGLGGGSHVNFNPDSVSEISYKPCYLSMNTTYSIYTACMLGACVVLCIHVIIPTCCILYHPIARVLFVRIITIKRAQC